MVIKNVTLKDGGLLYRNGKELEGVLNGAKVGGILNAHKLFSPRHRWIPPATGALKQFFQIKGAGNYCIATDPDNAYIDASIVAYNTALVKSTVGSMA